MDFIKIFQLLFTLLNTPKTFCRWVVLLNLHQTYNMQYFILFDAHMWFTSIAPQHGHLVNGLAKSYALCEIAL
jgi:hypothetical protein